MAHIKVIKDWTPFRFFPWAETRELGAFSDVLPSVPMSLIPFWKEYRWRPRTKKAE